MKLTLTLAETMAIDYSSGSSGLSYLDTMRYEDHHLFSVICDNEEPFHHIDFLLGDQ